MLQFLPGQLPHRTLIYLDPPYYLKGPELYRNFEEHTDHSDIEKMLLGMDLVIWMVPYDNVPEVSEICENYPQKYSLSYMAGTKSKGSALIVHQPGLLYYLEMKPFKYPTAEP